MRAAKPGETFVFSGGIGEFTRRCAVEEFDLTAHANREGLLDFVGEVGPRVVLLSHGDGPSRQWFAEQITRRYPRIIDTFRRHL